MKKDSFKKKLAAYIVMSEAFLLAHPVDADAQIMYTDVNPDMVVNSGFNYILDLNQDGFNDLNFVVNCNSNFYTNGSSAGSASYNGYEKAYGINGAAFVRKTVTQNCDNNPVPLPNGTPIGVVPGELFGFSPTLYKYHVEGSWSGMYYTSWSTNSGCFGGPDDYLGVRISVGGQFYYGWVRLSVGNCGITIKEYAVKLNPNSNIQAGVVPACPMPGTLSVTNLTNHSAKINWNTQSQAIGYGIQYRIAGTSSWTLFYNMTNIGFKNLTALTPNTTYEWRVKSICQQNPFVVSPYTPIQTFTTPLRLEDESTETTVTETANELFIYPNPASNEIHFLMNEEGDFTMSIFNITGIEVMKEFIHASEDEVLSVQTGVLSAGTYIYHISSSEKTYSGKFMIE